MSLATKLEEEIQKGLNGTSGVIPIQYDRVCDYIKIAKRTSYLIGAATGVGKTTLAQEMFTIDPIEWYLNNQSSNIKLSVIDFFMERRQVDYTAKWISRMLFQDHGITLPSQRIIGREYGKRLTVGEHELIKGYYAKLNEWEKDDLLIIHEGSKNPTGISLYLEKFAEKHGIIYKKDKADKSIDNILTTVTYEPNHANHIVIIVTDNFGILAPEGDGKVKTVVDKASRCMREARDWYGFSNVIIQQLNREIDSVGRHKMPGELIPKLSDFAASSQTQNDADVVIALFNPFDYAVTEKSHLGYDVQRFKDDKFRTFYRSLHILKNSFGSTGIGFPMALQPEYGLFKTLPRGKEIPEDIYSRVVSGSYFLPQYYEEPISKRPFSGFNNNKTIIQ